MTAPFSAPRGFGKLIEAPGKAQFSEHAENAPQRGVILHWRFAATLSLGRTLLEEPFLDIRPERRATGRRFES